MNRTQHGATALRIWMAAENITVTALSDRLSCSREHLSNLRTGKSAPGRSLALRIERESGGAVRAESWDAPSKAA